MDAETFRAEFPVFQRAAFLNAGSDGPVPRRGADAAMRQIERELVDGRAGRPHFEHLFELGAELRARLARFLGCSAEDLALTRSTSDGVATVMAALRLEPGDEVLTSDEEHPGLLAPLEAARRRHGFDVRVAPFAELAGEVGPRTRLVACSHVSWVGGQVVDAQALAASDALVLLDGAQGLGATPAGMEALGCDFYAASGQKWLCGPDGSGCLYVRREIADQLDPPWPSYMSLADPSRPSELHPHPGARRFDLGFSGPLLAWALGSTGLIEEAGLEWVHERGATLAVRLADALGERGLSVSPRGRSTLVSWASEDAEGDVGRMAERGVLVRYLPGRGLVRASLGAWNNEDDVGQLLEAVDDVT